MEQRHERVLDAALRRFAEHGYQRTRIEEIDPGLFGAGAAAARQRIDQFIELLRGAVGHR